MLQVPAASCTSLQDLRIGNLVHNPWAVGTSHRRIARLKSENCCGKRRRRSVAAADCQIGRNLSEEIAKTRRAFATFAAQIFGRQQVHSNLEKLPLFFYKDGQQLQYAWDGQTLCVVPVDQKQEKAVSGPPLGSQLVQTVVDRIGRTLYRTFVPQQVRPHYLAYMKWKSLHRLSSSVIQVLCTQAMLQAIGVGARRSLPAAAGLNWVLKDGLGRLGRFAYSGLLGPTFDSNLKKVRFSTSVLFSLCLGLEMLTPFFPNYFLLFATMANIGRSIALSAYLATTSAIHKSFALGDNLADIAAKGQVQTVVADNLGLAVAVAIGCLGRLDKRLEPVLLLSTFSILTSLDLYAIYHELQSVHLLTLNKVRLEIIVDGWLHNREVPSAKEVSKAECRQLLKTFELFTDQKSLPLRIGALNPRGLKPDDIRQAFHCQSQQEYVFFVEMQGSIPLFYQPGLLLWLQNGFTAKKAITAVLQAGFMRSVTSPKCGSSSDKQVQREKLNSAPILGVQVQHKSEYTLEELKNCCGSWDCLLAKSRQEAEANVDDLISAMEDNGWQTQHILLDPRERQSYSTQLSIKID